MLSWVTKFTHVIEENAVKAGFVYKLASRYYNSVIQKESDLAGITNKDHILCIGGGICPFSAILFHQKTGARVTVIDNNEKCIPKARKVIERLGIGEKVRVLYQDGSSKDIHFADYSVIHFALQVFPMEEVFRSVEQRAVPGTKLLIRRPKKQLNHFYCELADCLFPCCPYAVHKSRNIGSTVLYIKKAADACGAMAAVA